MLEYKRIDYSEGIDVNKTNLTKECDICHYWYFKDIGFKYEHYLCNGSNDLLQKAMSFNIITIVYVKRNACIIHFWYISKDDAINIMNGYNLVDKRGVLYDLTYYQRNRDVVLSKAKDYYKNNKDRLREQARDKNRNLSEDKKNIVIFQKKRTRN